MMNQTTRPNLPVRGEPITLEMPDYHDMVFTNTIDARHFCEQFNVPELVQIVPSGDGWILQDPAPDTSRNARYSDADVNPLLDALETIADNCNRHMGDWSCADYVYVPERFETDYNNRQTATDALAAFKVSQ